MLATTGGLVFKPLFQLDWVESIAVTLALPLLVRLTRLLSHDAPFLAVPSEAGLLSTERHAHCG